MMAMGILQQQLLQNASAAVSQPNGFHEQLATHGSWYSHAPHGSMMPPPSIAPCVPALTLDMLWHQQGHLMAYRHCHRLTHLPKKTVSLMLPHPGSSADFVVAALGKIAGPCIPEVGSWTISLGSHAVESAFAYPSSRPLTRCLDGSLDAAWASDVSPLLGREDAMFCDTAQKPHHLLRDAPIPWPRAMLKSTSLSARWK